MIVAIFPSWVEILKYFWILLNFCFHKISLSLLVWTRKVTFWMLKTLSIPSLTTYYLTKTQYYLHEIHITWKLLISSLYSVDKGKRNEKKYKNLGKIPKISFKCNYLWISSERGGGHFSNTSELSRGVRCSWDYFYIPRYVFSDASHKTLIVCWKSKILED